MKSTPLVASLAILMATTSGLGFAQAQPADPDYQQQQQTYEQQQQRYQNAQSDYQNRTADYQTRRDAYQRAHARFEHEKAEYDARYGEGAFIRYWHDRRDDYDARYGPGAWDRDFGEHRDHADGRDHPDAMGPGPADYYRDYRDNPCEQRARDHAVVGGLIGALAGAAIGSNLAAGGGRTGGAVIGAVLGGAVGANVGHSTARCDEGGYYFTYDQTYPYREGEWEHGPSGRYDNEYYHHHGCRLAVAPAHGRDGDDYRYVRVCPDDHGHYRITD